MKDTIPFGPGHPDYDAQLDLFDHSDGGLVERDERLTGDQEDWPANAEIRFPCSFCIASAPFQMIQPLRGRLQAQERNQEPLPDNLCPVSGVVCNGDDPTVLRFRRTESFWFDACSDALIKAESWHKAVKKAGGDPARKDCPIALSIHPFYSEHGGYGRKINKDDG